MTAEARTTSEEYKRIRTAEQNACKTQRECELFRQRYETARASLVANAQRSNGFIWL